MPQAQITINGTPGSDDDLPIDTLIQLGNNGVGGELTYTWEILDQPDGPDDVLSNAAIPNPTFTPLKEGTYLLELIVNQGTGTEVRDQRIAAVRQLKSRGRVMAAGESTEDDATKGWKEAGNDWLQKVDGLLADAGMGVAIAGVGGLAVNDVLLPNGKATIKTGLPGQETLPKMTKALATSATDVASVLFVCKGGVDGNVTPGNGDLIKYRVQGPVYGVVTAGTPAVGDPVYISDAGRPVLAPGTNNRKIGRVIAFVAATSFDYWHNGLNT